LTELRRSLRVCQSVPEVDDAIGQILDAA